MQNKYAGDVGDFGKLGLLKHIVMENLSLGVNWYLVRDENYNGDGKLISYLAKKEFFDCDNDLIDKLRPIATGDNRSVKKLEEMKFLGNTIYYSDILESPASRDVWHKAAMQKLECCDIVFLDPDNGLLANGVSISSPKSIKYVTVNELKDYYRSGKSVIFYNHRCHQKEELYLERFRKLKSESDFINSKWYGLKFPRGTIRDYFFIVQPHHEKLVETAINKLLFSNWQRHFQMLQV